MEGIGKRKMTMKKKPLLLITAFLMLVAGCTGQKEPGSVPAARTNKDWVNTDVIGTVTADMDVRIQDDFNLAVNREYLLGVKIPDGMRQAGGLYDVDLSVKQRLIETMKDETLTSRDAQLVQEYYRMMMDWDTRNEKGTEPIRPYVEEVRSLQDLDQMTEYFINGRISPQSGSLFTYAISTSFEDPDARMLEILPPSLSLEDAAEYRNMTENGKIKKDMHTAVWNILLAHLGFSQDEAEQIIANTFRIETLLAEHKYTVEELNDPGIIEKIWNPMDLKEVQELAGSFPVTDILKGWGAGEANICNVEEIDFVKSLEQIYTEENFPALRDWLTIKTISGCEDLPDQSTRNEARNAANAILGISGVESDDRAALDQIYQILTVPIDNMYIQKYCTEQLRSDIIDIIYSVIEEYRVMLAEEDWLSEETREKAIEKLDHIRIRAVYPDQPGDWSDLSFTSIEDGGNLVDATFQIKEYVRLKKLSLVNERVDKDVWNQSEMPASLVNAFYQPQDNSINIMAGVLNDIVYQDDFTYEQKLGTVGMVIGHEISHAFDPTGSQFDMDGSFSSWWTKEDREAFDQRSQKLIRYYDALEPFKGIRYSGSRVQGEAIADLGAIKCMLRIAKKTENFDYRAFFERYAKLWAVQRIESLEINRASNDTHPLGYLRVNAVVQQFDEFYETYDVKEGDGMYLAPEDRICVW